MVVRMMRWRPWPPPSSKKFEAKIVVHRLEGLPEKSTTTVGGELQEFSRLSVEVKWKGSNKTNSPLNFKRTIVRRNFTKEESLRQDGMVDWNEEFVAVCNFFGLKDGVFHPWEVAFTVFDGVNQGQKRRVHAVATGSLNLVEFVSAEQKETEISIPLSVASSCTECSPILCVSLSLLELRVTNETTELAERSVLPLPSSPHNRVVLTTEKDELSGLKAGLRKVKIFKALSANRAKKACREEEGSDGKGSVRSEDTDYPFDTDSLDEADEVVDSEEARDDSCVRKSFSYGTLAFANHAGGLFSFYSSGSEEEDWIYYQNYKMKADESSVSITDPSERQSPKRSIFPWRKRKLSFRSPKARGEPLLKKDCGEEGGDDIDFDRRMLSSSDESTNGHKGEEGSTTNRSSISEFGDDNFAVGTWENKEVISRDGHMKLQTQVFFASIDQRSERAAGESACTALVAIIADWLQNNCNEMPIKCQLDSLIREGSSEWRKLCENEAYRERFPDKHFDLDTVLEAKIRNLLVVPEKSFIGFFQPEGLEEGGLDILDGAMSFDSIWDEISQIALNNANNMEPLVYIISWNDHFFILKVEKEAYYIIDTLGERLYEGCNEAYVLKFDKDTTIRRLPNESQKSNEKPNEKAEDKKVDESELTDASLAIVNTDEAGKTEIDKEELIMCRGKESCKEYIKSFLAAIPIRELQADLKKGLMASSTPLVHHRLQIEFHYTKCLHDQQLQPVGGEFSLVEANLGTPAIIV